MSKGSPPAPDQTSDGPKETENHQNSPNNSRKIKYSNSAIFLGTLLVILIISTILSALNPDFAQNFSMSTWFSSENYQNVSFWAAVGYTMLACFLGALIPFPIPYGIPITIFASVWITTYSKGHAWNLIFWLVFFATLSNTLGDFIDYIIGEGAEYFVRKDDPELSSRWAKVILKKPKLIPWVIMLFGATPLPDSLLLPPLGFIHYNKWKTMLYMFLGKIIMMTAYALAGVYTIDWLISITGGEESSTGWISGIVLLYIMWFLMVLMVKYKPKPE